MALSRPVASRRPARGGNGGGAMVAARRGSRPPPGRRPLPRGRARTPRSAPRRARRAPREPGRAGDRAGEGVPAPSRAWKIAPRRGQGDGAREQPVHRQDAGGDPDLLARHRRHRRGRHRRVDEAERDPEEQVAGQQQRVGAGRVDLGEDQQPGGADRPSRRSSARAGAEAWRSAGRRSGEMKTIGTVIGRIIEAADAAASGRARPAGTGAGRTSPPSRRRPGRRRRRWRRSRGRCGRGRTRRSAPGPGARPARRRPARRAPTTASATTAAVAQASDWTSARTTAVRPRLSAARPGQSILRPAPGSVDSGAAQADDQHPERGDRQVDPGRSPASRFRPGRRRPAGRSPAPRPRPRPRSRAPAAARSAGKTLQTRASERVSTGAAPAPCRTRPSDQQLRVAGQPGDDRADRRRRPSRAGRPACGRTCRRAGRR